MPLWMGQYRAAILKLASESPNTQHLLQEIMDENWMKVSVMSFWCLQSCPLLLICIIYLYYLQASCMLEK